MSGGRQNSRAESVLAWQVLSGWQRLADEGLDEPRISFETMQHLDAIVKLPCKVNIMLRCCGIAGLLCY